MLGRIQNALEVSNEDYSQSRCPILVCLIMLATREVACGLRKARQLLKKPAGIPLCRWQRVSSRAKAPRAHWQLLVLIL